MYVNLNLTINSVMASKEETGNYLKEESTRLPQAQVAINGCKDEIKTPRNAKGNNDKVRARHPHSPESSPGKLNATNDPQMHKSLTLPTQKPEYGTEMNTPYDQHVQPKRRSFDERDIPGARSKEQGVSKQTSSSSTASFCEDVCIELPVKMKLEITCVTNDDKSPCNITRMTSLSNGDLVVYDADNFHLKAFDKHGKFFASIENIYNLEDMTFVKDHLIAISQNNHSFVSFFKLKEDQIKFKPGLQLNLRGNGYRCKYSRERFCVTCDATDPKYNTLCVMDNKGKAITERFLNDLVVSDLAMHPRRDYVYLSSASAKKIVCFDYSGGSFTKVWDFLLYWTPGALAVICNKYVLVSNTENERIYIFRSKKYQQLNNTECCNQLCHHPDTNRVYAKLSPVKVLAYKVDTSKIEYLDLKRMDMVL